MMNKNLKKNLGHYIESWVKHFYSFQKTDRAFIFSEGNNAKSRIIQI